MHWKKWKVFGTSHAPRQGGAPSIGAWGDRSVGIDADILPKHSASIVVAQQEILGDHAAPQQPDHSPCS
jgi:hypothetical protein